MARSFVDCRDLPGGMGCTVAISADREEELLEAAVQHIMAVHRRRDTPAFRDEVRQLFRKGHLP